MNQTPEYKPTLFDRHGPDAGGYMRAAAYSMLVFGISITVGFIMMMGGMLKPTLLTVAGIFVAAAVFATFIWGMTTGISDLAGGAYKHLMMSGSTTPYKEQYSYQQALVMQGKVDEALESFEAVIAENPDAIDARFKAADLYARSKGNPRRAAELFREVQRIPAATTGEDIFAANRLIDLLNGPLNEPGRALVELRRLIEKYPGSAAAKHARDALAQLKAHQTR